MALTVEVPYVLMLGEIFQMSMNRVAGASAKYYILSYGLKQSQLIGQDKYAHSYEQ